jgi:hypothetical protein
MTKRYTSADHAFTYPDLLTEQTLEALRNVKRQGLGFLKASRRQELVRIANDFRVPNERRHSGREIISFLDGFYDIVNRAVKIKEKGIQPGVRVRFGQEERVVKAIGMDYLLTFENGGRCSPFGIDIIT